MNGTNRSLELEWHFLQCFGQPQSAEEAPDSDVLSALEFSQNGQYLATGDRGGRVVLLEKVQHLCAQPHTHPDRSADNGDAVHNSAWMLQLEYNYLMEFQSHTTDFDFLQSTDIAECINSIAWLNLPAPACMLLTCNNQQVKLWKVFEKQVSSVVNYNLPRTSSPGSSVRHTPRTSIDRAVDLRVPRLTPVVGAKELTAKCKHEYSLDHAGFFNSVSVNCDQATFLSADDQLVHFWSLERPDHRFAAVDLRATANPNNGAEVITCARFHPNDCNVYGFSTSRGVVNLCDAREQDARAEHSVAFADQSFDISNNFFTEFLNNVSTFHFASGSMHFVSRNYMCTSVWDMRQNREPVRAFEVHPRLWNRLMDLYERDAFFDRLSCDISPNGNYVAASTYGETRIFNVNSDTFSVLKANNRPRAVHDSSAHGDDVLDLTWKVENVVWHPEENLVVASALNSLYTYCAHAPTPEG